MARLIKLEEARRYAISDIESRLGALPAEGHESNAGVSSSAGSSEAFDPHKGGEDVPAVVKEEVAQELRLRGAMPFHDGRLVGPCPFPGHTGEHLSNLLYSPISGGYWCFGNHHPGRDPHKTCASGGVWTLWCVLFPGRPAATGDEMCSSSPLGRCDQRGEEADDSRPNSYDPPVPAVLEVLRDAPRHRRTAALLRSVGQEGKAFAEENCGVPIKGQCSAHGFVREGRASGKTPWCAGCNTETSAKYLRTSFPIGDYTILRLRRRLGPVSCSRSGLDGTPQLGPGQSEEIANRVRGEFDASTNHFRRVQRRFEDACLGWHFAVGHDQDGLCAELQVLVRNTTDFAAVLRNLTGLTRKAPLFRPDAVVRSDYPPARLEQLRRDWASLLRCTLLSLGEDALFRPIYDALSGRQRSQTYGELRARYHQRAEDSPGLDDDVKTCPVVSEGGRRCGQQLTYFFDPYNEFSLSPFVYRSQAPPASSLAPPTPRKVALSQR